MADPENKVPFPLAGEGACLRFRTADLVKLREKFGEPKISPEGEYESFTDRIDILLRLHDPLAVLFCLQHGLKKADGRQPFTGLDYNDLPFPPSACVQEIRDAIVLAITGVAYAVLLAEQKAKQEENARLRAAGVEFEPEDPTDPR